MKTVGKTLTLDFALKPLAAVAIAGALLAGCATAPSDADVAKMTRVDNLNNYRFCEIWLVNRHAKLTRLSG